MSLFVIKIGSQSLLDEHDRFDRKQILQVAESIHELRILGHQCVIVSSGACALGQSILGGEARSTLSNQVTASIGQPLLMKEYQEAFSYFHIIVAQTLLTRDDFSHKRSYSSVKKVLEAQLHLGIVPIINENDVVASEEIVFSDNDQLASFVTIMLGADTLFILSNIPGLCDKHPNQWWKVISEVQSIDDTVFGYVSREKSKSGRGGMYSKLLSAQNTTQSGIDFVLLPAFENRAIPRFLSWEKLGTYFHKIEQKTSSINKNWLRAGATSEWSITVNTCLADLLRAKRRLSILDIWVIKVDGLFAKDAIIDIKDDTGTMLARWKTRLSSDEIRQYDFQDRSRIVVHADHWIFI